MISVHNSYGAETKSVTNGKVLFPVCKISSQTREIIISISRDTSTGHNSEQASETLVDNQP